LPTIALDGSTPNGGFGRAWAAIRQEQDKTLKERKIMHLSINLHQKLATMKLLLQLSPRRKVEWMDKEDATANNRENNETNDGVQCAVSDDDG
jgi:hypothetical protein